MGKRFLVEAVEHGTTLGGELVDMLCLLDEVYCLDALAEVALVNLLAKDGLIDMLQLSEGEQFRQQVET